MIKVFGHKAPDTDSTGSAIIWAWYLTEMKGQSAQAVLLGAPNTEATFVTQRWGFETPEIIADVGDNDMVRAGYTVLRVREPAVVPDVAPATGVSVSPRVRV